MRYWTLSTGSHIAYLRVRAQGRASATPIILVGGGPGEEDVADSSQRQFFGQLATAGYDVYFYDQIGSGLSARLVDPGQYTLARHQGASPGCSHQDHGARPNRRSDRLQVGHMARQGILSGIS